jgi:protein involved in polysaccharide export with SLBB domain/uncharacterized protein involved in exopolysaccharide biosynthesis
MAPFRGDGYAPGEGPAGAAAIAQASVRDDTQTAGAFCNMNDPGESGLSAANRQRGHDGTSTSAMPNRETQPHLAEPTLPSRSAGQTETKPGEGGVAFLAVDPLRLVMAVLRGWWRILAGGLVAAGVAASVGLAKFGTYYTATVQLIRREVPGSYRASDVGESFKPRQFSVGTVTAMMRSPDFLAQVGAQARVPLSGRRLGASLAIAQERNTDLITVTFQTDADAAAAAEVLNLYAQRVVDLTKALQAQEAGELDKFLRDRLAKTEDELAAANQEIVKFSREANFVSAEKEAETYLRALNEAELRIQTARLEREALEFRIASVERELAQHQPQKLRLAEARDRLTALRTQYTDRNPFVIEQQATVTALERQVESATNQTAAYQAGGNTVVNSLYLDLINFKGQREVLDMQFPQLQAYRSNMLARLQSLPEKSMLYARLKAHQTSLETTRDLLTGRQREAQMFAENSPGYYRLFAPMTPELVEVSSRDKKVVMVSVAGFLLGAGAVLVLLALVDLLDDRVLTGGDLRRLIGRPLVAELGELSTLTETDLATWRFRTWSVLQRQLERTEAGAIVLGLLSAKAGEGRSAWIHLLQAAAAERQWRTLAVVNRADPSAGQAVLPLGEILNQPQRVTQALAKSNHLMLLWNADWAWNADQRAQWHAALRDWQALPGLAILVELPPAERLESVMAAETLPQVFWLCQSGVSRKGETGALLSTLQLAQVNLSGTFLNRGKTWHTGWLGLSRLGVSVAAAGSLWLGALAGESAGPLPTSDTTNFVFSATAASPQLAPWQERLVLGPGDMVNLSIYGKKQLTRTEVPVGPDGRISYLQVSGVMAAGLTIDELRDKLTEELSRYFRNARVIVTPFAWRSKKYYLLGTIMDRGTFYLDQPMTIIEATSRARGIATGLLEQNTVEIADLPRTFLVRQGKRLPVDFARLFQQGDLSQNIQLEPGDFIYFPSATVNEVYVLGAVASPGTVGVTAKASVISVLTTRGGFTPKAYKQRVLVVRGSLNRPEPQVVDVGAVLAGKGADFLVEPKDIIYVADRPWARVEELLDMAIKAFVITATAEWVNMNVGPIITEPIFPGP